MLDTVKERRAHFQAMVWNAEKKYGLSTKQAVAMLIKEMKEACYVDQLG